MYEEDFLQLFVDSALQAANLNPQRRECSRCEMVEAVDFKLAFDINVAFRYCRRPSKSEAQALVQGIHMPEDDLLLLCNHWRVIPQRFCAVIAACLTQPGGHCNEMPRYRGPRDVNSIEALYQSNNISYSTHQWLDRRKARQTHSKQQSLHILNLWRQKQRKVGQRRLEIRLADGHVRVVLFAQRALFVQRVLLDKEVIQHGVDHGKGGVREVLGGKVDGFAKLCKLLDADEGAQDGEEGGRSGWSGSDYMSFSNICDSLSIPLTCFKRETTVASGGIGNLLTPPGGTGFCRGNRGPWLIERCFCISTSWLRLASAVSILGLRGRRGPLLTARSRNSLAKVVCTVRPESPPRTDSSSELS